MIVIAESEASFQRRLTDLAEELGWEWMHIGRVGKYVANGAKGTLGSGWPDLTLLRGSRLLFVELKAQQGPGLTVTQKLVLGRLSMAAEAYVWRPSDWAQILHVLA
jgi:hypothetical protein